MIYLFICAKYASNYFKKMNEVVSFKNSKIFEFNI